MKLYHLGCCFHEYADYTEYYLGTYDSTEGRKAAKQIYLDNKDKLQCIPFENRHDHFEWQEWESELNQHFLL
jgi:hypothetical protein